VSSGTSKGAYVLIVTSAATFMGALDVTIVNIAIEGITRGLKVTNPTHLAWVLSGYSIVYAATLLGFGRLADWKGRKRIFLTGLAIFGIGSALCGAAPTLWVLLVARVIQAVGAAMVTPASLALVLGAFPPNKRASAVGVWGAVGSLAGALAPTIGAGLNRAFGWRSLFFINIPVIVAGLIAGRSVLTESRDPKVTKLPDLVGAVIVTIGVGLVVFAIIESETWGLADSRFWIILAVAAVLLTMFVRRCNAVDDPVLDISLLRQRFFAVSNISAMLYTFAFFGIFLTNVRFFYNVWDYTEYGSGMAITPIPVTASIVGVLSGRILRTIGARAGAAVSGSCFAGGLLLIVALTGNTPNYWEHVAWPMVLIGIGIGLGIAVINTSGTMHLPVNRYSMGSAFISTGRQVGAALGVALALALFAPVSKGADPLTRAHLSWVVFAITGLIAGLAVTVFYRQPATASQ
jgi:EmrB/QacA subfamily drug resistance transporter